ncbi:MAG: OFA family MFS transporter [Desulfomonilia bacterium]|nr:OFA family MFS transporter [Bacillota bacterium]
MRETRRANGENNCRQTGFGVDTGQRKWICIAGVLIQLCLGTIYAWSIFKNPFMTLHGWTDTQTQGAFMIQSAVFGFSVAFGGAIVDRRGPRQVGLFGGVIFGIGLALAGYANTVGSMLLLYLSYGILSGLGGGLGYICPVTTLIRWFPDKRGLITGLAVMGYGLGAFVMGNIGPVLILKVGLSGTFYIWGFVTLIIVTSMMVLMVNPPESWLPKTDGLNANVYATLANPITLSDAIRTRQFWTMWVIVFITISSGLGLISQISPMAQDLMVSGFGDAISEDKMNSIILFSGTIVALAGVFNGTGRIFWAWMSDMMGRKAILACIYIIQALGYFMLARTQQVWIFTVIVCCLVACYGGVLSCMPAMAADQFGAKHIGKIYGLLFTANALSGLAGPFINAYIKDVTNSFGAALNLEAGMMALGLLLVVTFTSTRPSISSESVNGPGGVR